MSTTTDQSFIRAFKPTPEDETMKPKVTPWTVQSAGAVAASPQAINQVVIGPSTVEDAFSVMETHFSLPEQVAAANRAATRVVPRTSPQISGQVTTSDAPRTQSAPPAAQPAPTRHYRIETGDASMPTPHFLRMQRDGMAGRQTNQFAVGQQDLDGGQRPSGNIRPQWEVDEFRWPVVCDVLQDTSSHRLKDVVESMIAQAELGNKVVAVTSFDRKEGRSTIAMSLARLAAQSKLDIALVDGDLDEPSIGTYLGITFDTSWNHIDPKLPLGEAAIVSIKDQFVVFPAGHDTAFPERTVRNNAGPLLASICESFDLVFVDVGPIYTAAHRWLMPESCNLIRNALVVRDVRRTSVEQVDDACCRLVKAGVQNMAIIDNFQGGGV
jgi:Mrp family chromosome partitioning ATPase